MNTKEKQCVWIDGEVGEVSDGYHTFNQLYEHRITLYINLCKVIQNHYSIWRSQYHSDGTSISGWFLLGINKKVGEQITYHLPLSRWDDTNFAETLYQAPPFDGHTSEDVLARLENLNYNFWMNDPFPEGFSAARAFKNAD